MSKKIIIIGSGGVGKSVLARAIGEILDSPPEIIVVSPKSGIVPKDTSFAKSLAIKPIPLLCNTIFNPPLTRADRRKQERLKNIKGK